MTEGPRRLYAVPAPAAEPKPPPVLSTVADWICRECVESGKRGTCAPKRCYCGHKSCHGYPSWLRAHPEERTP